MKLKPNYSLDYNEILNPTLSNKEQLTNFASLISDKDRFLSIIPFIEKNSKLICEKLGTQLPSEIEFYVVRAEKFKSFSSPITIEYSILPEEMLVYLLKEIIKKYAPTIFPDYVTRERYVNSLVDYIIINGEFRKLNLVKYSKNLHDESKKKYDEYQLEDIDFSKTTLKKHIENLYEK